jgi:hypothetical protein
LVTERDYRLVNVNQGRIAMDKRKAIESAGDNGITNSESTPEQLKIELPFIASPPTSPTTPEIVAQAMEETAGDTSIGDTAEISSAAGSGESGIAAKDAPKSLFFNLRFRHNRHAMLAASVAIAAAFGAIVGAAATVGLSQPATVGIAAEGNKATQESVARLANEITGLKANLEAASKSANSQIAKISERLNRESAGITNSVGPPQTVPAAAQASASMPSGKPPVAAESHSTRPAIVPDWSIREARDGYIYVQGHGDVYQVVPGAPLPGLGPVEKIKRQDGRWLVVTPKGIIVSMRDRRYFEQF